MSENEWELPAGDGTFVLLDEKEHARVIVTSHNGRVTVQLAESTGRAFGNRGDRVIDARVKVVRLSGK